MDESLIRIILLAAIHGVIWGLFYYYVRKGWNSANYYEKRKKILEIQLKGEGTKKEFYGDAIYGALATFFVYILRKLIKRMVPTF